MEKQYLKFSDFELSSLLADVESLTFEAQVNLKKELERRDLNIFDGRQVEKLEEIIDDGYKKVASLETLRRIGFDSKWEENEVCIYRPIKVTNTDILFIFLGLIIILISLIGLVYLTMSFTYFNGYFIPLLLVFSMLIFFRYGFLVISNAWYRYRKYDNFKLVLKSQTVLFSKNSFKGHSEKRTAKLENLIIRESNSAIKLFLSELELIKIDNPSFIERLALKAVVSIKFN